MVLPGTFDAGRAERLTAGVGRCTVCDLDPAAYADRANVRSVGRTSGLFRERDSYLFESHPPSGSPSLNYSNYQFRPGKLHRKSI